MEMIKGRPGRRWGRQKGIENKKLMETVRRPRKQIYEDNMERCLEEEARLG